MASHENSDAILLKGIRLLNSNAEGSEEQLRQLLEDCIRQKYGSNKVINLGPRKMSATNFKPHIEKIAIKHSQTSHRLESSTKKENVPKISSSSLSSRKDDVRKDVDKRSVDKNSEEIPEVSRDVSTRKSETSKSSHLKSSGSSPSSPHSITMSILRDMDPVKDELILADDDDDLALEILEEDLACVICRGMDVGVRNQLVECLECHSLYHQECHQPPVPDDMNEPRSAWYCADCSKSLNKVPSKSSRASPKPSTSASIRDREVPVGSSKHSMKMESTQPQSQSLYKRNDKGNSSNFPGSSKGGGSSNMQPLTSSKSSNIVSGTKTSSASSGKICVGLPLPVKTLGTSSSLSSTSKASSSNSSKAVVPKINIVSADRRLAIMKKKAAKQQEKRKLTK